jgi:ribulose-phosphate 3-epimerase
MSEIIPTILADSKQEFENKLRIAEKFASTVQIDILDGSLFPVTNWHDADEVGKMATSVAYELHLMVSNPLPIIAEWVAKVPNVKRAIFHAEIQRPLGRIIEEIHTTHLIEAGVAINPETPLEEIHDVLSILDVLLVMNVHPGKNGGISEGDYILDKIANAKNRAPGLTIEVDGGVTAKLIPNFMKVGVTRFALASALFKAPDPKEAWKNLQEALQSTELL